MKGDSQLERSVYDTVRYFSLFEMPMTEVQIWRSLIVDHEGIGVRWHGHHVPTLKDVRDVLAGSGWLEERIGEYWGYYFLYSALDEGDVFGQRYVRRRLLRHALAQQKWKITRRVVGWLTWLPFVRMIGGSGSLAMFNTDEESDLDLFVVTGRKRIWTTRLGLLIVSQLSGRRRKYWNVVAPDKICLNHFVTEDSLLMDREIRNLYTAQLYAKFVPLFGTGVYKEWWEANLVWIRKWIMCPEVNWLPSSLFVGVRVWLEGVKRLFESVLVELPGDIIESVGRKLQLWSIEKHRKGQDGWYDRIKLSDKELAFHPNTKVPLILRRYEEEEGQGQLF